MVCTKSKTAAKCTATNCPFKTYYPWLLKDHEKNHIKRDDRPKCDYCDYWATSSQLTKHEYLHLKGQKISAFHNIYCK